MSESAPGRAGSSNDARDKKFPCPTCDRDDFATKQGMKTHHARIHNESLAHTVPCYNCGDEFQRRKAVAEENDHNFCDDDCRAEWLSESMNGEGNHNHVQSVNTECKTCGNTFEHKPYIDRTYCSRECRNNRVDGSESNFWTGGKVELTCAGCGDIFFVHPSLTDQRKHCSQECAKRTIILECDYCGSDFDTVESNKDRRRCCSQECWHQFRAQQPPEKQPNYKGGHADYYGPNWPKQRQKARARDNYNCQYCGEDLSDKEDEPDVHHIKRIAWFKNNLDAPEWYEQGNRLENLRTACDSCHGKWEGIPVAPE